MSRRFSSSTSLICLRSAFSRSFSSTSCVVVVPEVGADQGGFKIVKGVAVDLLAEGNCFLNALGEIFARARDRFLHAVEETWFFLLFFEAAEKGLNHKYFASHRAFHYTGETEVDAEAGLCGMACSCAEEAV